MFSLKDVVSACEEDSRQGSVGLFSELCVQNVSRVSALLHSLVGHACRVSSFYVLCKDVNVFVHVYMCSDGLFRIGVGLTVSPGRDVVDFKGFTQDVCAMVVKDFSSFPWWGHVGVLAVNGEIVEIS